VPGLADETVAEDAPVEGLVLGPNGGEQEWVLKYSEASQASRVVT
jgi:hypothetical protein